MTLAWIAGAAVVAVVLYLWLGRLGNLGFWNRLAKNPEAALDHMLSDPAWFVGNAGLAPAGWVGPFKLRAYGQTHTVFADPDGLEQSQARLLEQIGLSH